MFSGLHDNDKLICFRLIDQIILIILYRLNFFYICKEV